MVSTCGSQWGKGNSVFQKTFLVVTTHDGSERAGIVPGENNRCWQIFCGALDKAYPAWEVNRAGLGN